MSAVEREIKLALECEDDYRRLCERLPGFREEVRQQNTYWDLPDGSLRRSRVMLRLRVEEARALLTVKRDHRQTAEGVFEAPEDEETVDLPSATAVVTGERPFETLQSEVLTRLQTEFGFVTGLCAWGSMVNLRRRYELPEGFTVEVDRTCFMQSAIEHEVEVESDDLERAREVILAYLDREKIRYRPQTQTKSQRLRGYLDGA